MNALTHKPLSSRSILGVILILGPVIFAFALALDIYVPSIPDLRQYFGVSQGAMQLTVTMFLLFAGVGQLLFGPVSDQIGRSKMVLFSILLLLAGSIVCVLAFDIEMLIVGRIIQALGACGMMVTCFAIVRDLFSEEECGRVYSFLNSTIALSPLLAPIAGGYLTYWFNWRASFVFLALLMLVIFISAKVNINETLSLENRRSIKKEIFKDYLAVLKNINFLIYTFCASAGFAGFLTFFSSSAYIIIKLLHVPKQHFGFYFASIGIVFFCGSLLSGWCSKLWGIHKTVLIGAILMILSGLVMLIWYKNFGLTMSGFMWPMMLMGVGGACLMGGGAGGAIAPFPQMAGTASALFGCAQFVFAVLISQTVLEWQVRSTIPLGNTLAILGSASLILCLTGIKKLK